MSSVKIIMKSSKNKKKSVLVNSVGKYLNKKDILKSQNLKTFLHLSFIISKKATFRTSLLMELKTSLEKF